MIVSSFFIRSLVRQWSPGRMMQVSSICWVGVRIGLHSGWNMPKIRPIRPGAGEDQGLGQLATGCRGAGLFGLYGQFKRFGAAYQAHFGEAAFRGAAVAARHFAVCGGVHRDQPGQ